MNAGERINTDFQDRYLHPLPNKKWIMKAYRFFRKRKSMIGWL